MSTKENKAEVIKFPQPPLEITLGDLTLVVQVIDVVTKRGAFEGSEIAEIGTLRNKFVAFINAKKSEKQPDAAAPEGDGPVTA